MQANEQSNFIQAPKWHHFDNSFLLQQRQSSELVAKHLEDQKQDPSWSRFHQDYRAWSSLQDHDDDKLPHLQEVELHDIDGDWVRQIQRPQLGEIQHSGLHEPIDDPLAPFSSISEFVQSQPQIYAYSLVPTKPVTVSEFDALDGSTSPSSLLISRVKKRDGMSLTVPNPSHRQVPVQTKRKRRNFTEQPPDSLELDKVQTLGCQNRFTSEQIMNAQVIPKRTLLGEVPCYHLLPCPVHGLTRHSQRSQRDLSLKCLECMSVNTWLWSKRQKMEDVAQGNRRGRGRGTPTTRVGRKTKPTPFASTSSGVTTSPIFEISNQLLLNE